MIKPEAARAKRVADFIYWLMWHKLPGKDVEDLVNMARGHDYSSVDRPRHQEATRLAEALMDLED